MNAERRKAISAAQTKLSTIIADLGNVVSEIESLKDEEQEYYDNMPDSLQGCERGDQAQAAVEAMEGFIEMANEFIDNAPDKLDEATG